MLKRLFLNDVAMVIAVVINAIVIFVGEFYEKEISFLYIDTAFTLFFLLEAIEKIRVYRWKGYWTSWWNRFDFVILLLAFPSLVNVIGIEFASTNVLFSLRIFRVFKVFRLLKFIPNVDALLKGLGIACKTSGLVCIAFAVSLLAFTVLTTAIFGGVAPEHFGNPALSVYSLFRLFTIEGWYELPDVIAARSSVMMGNFARLYFSLLVFAGGVIGMSLINSIFVDAMAEDNNDEVKDMIKDLDRKIEDLTRIIENEK